MRWLITGAHGQLGSDVQLVLAAAGVAPSDLRACSSAQLDVTDRSAIGAAFDSFAPDVVINAAAYTAVDQAETDHDRAFAVNATGPALLAAEADRRAVKLIHVSTDYVFNGAGTRPYRETDPTDPQSVYGRTKLAGELAVRELAPETSLVVRTAWVYGAVGSNFVKTMVRLERTQETLSVVDDQIGSPTWSFDLATALVELAQSPVTGTVLHCTNDGQTSWRGFAQAIFERLGADPERVQPTTTEQFPRPAPRPAYSVLDGQGWRSAGLTPMPSWSDALHRAFAAVGDQFRSASS